MFAHWLGSLRRKLSFTAASGRKRGTARHRAGRLQVEALEDRCVPAVAPGVAVASFFDSAVYRMDPGTGAVLDTLVAPYSQATLSGPAGLTVGPDGNLYISSQLNNSIVKINATTHALSTFIDSWVLGPLATANGDSQFAPAGLRFGPDGNLYVSLNGGQTATSGSAVVRFGITSSGSVLTFNGSATTIATGLIQPTEMTFGVRPDDLNTLYVSNSGVGSVVKIAHADGASPLTTTFIAAGSGGLNYPSGLSWGGPDGMLCVVDLGATSFVGQVLCFNPDGSFDQVLTQPASSLQFQFPSDLVYTPDGRLLTANLGPSHPPNLQGSISQFSASGTFLSQLVTSAQFPSTGPGTSGISPSQLTLDLGNKAPFASAGTAYALTAGSSLTLHATAADPDADNVTFSWDLNGDGTFGDAVGASPTLTWAQLVGLGGVSGQTSTANIRVAVSDGHGHVTTSAATVAVNNTQPSQLLTDKLYAKILGRDPSDTEVGQWTGPLSSGLPAGQAAQGFVQSPEHLTALVGRFYTDILGRTGSAQEIAPWVAALQGGLTYEQMLIGFLNSSEFFAHEGGTPTGYVRGLYQVLLGRTPSAEEVNVWVNAMTPMSNVQVIRSFLASPEFAGRTVDLLYRDYLGRTAASDPGSQGWVDQLLAAELVNARPGQPTQDVLRHLQLAILSSPEFSAVIDDLSHTSYFVIE
jgi:hypothetical protein